MSKFAAPELALIWGLVAVAFILPTYVGFTTRNVGKAWTLHVTIVAFVVAVILRLR